MNKFSPDTFVVIFWNLSPDHWVECGPYVEDFFPTEGEAQEAKMHASGEKNTRYEVWQTDLYYATF